MKKKLRDKRDIKIKNLYSEGYTVAYIMHKYGLSKSGVNWILSRSNYSKIIRAKSRRERGCYGCDRILTEDEDPLIRDPRYEGKPLKRIMTLCKNCFSKRHKIQQESYYYRNRDRINQKRREKWKLNPTKPWFRKIKSGYLY